MVMHNPLTMHLNSAHKVNTFTTKFKVIFDKRMSDFSNMKITLSSISAENTSTIKRDTTIKNKKKFKH